MSDNPKTLTPEQKHALVDYFVRGSNSKAILEDSDGFDGLCSSDVEDALHAFADALDLHIESDKMSPVAPGDTVKGDQWGVRFDKRGKSDNHICLQLLSEDDECWHEAEGGASSFWLQDLISVLKHAQMVLECRATPDPSGFGWVFIGEET